MPVRFEGEEIQTDRDVQELLTQVRRDPRTSNPRVLVINQLRQMLAKNDGYPVDMHHDTLAPTVANNEKEEEALAQAGFRREYKHRDFPMYLFRRNMHPKFQKSAEEKQRIHALTPEAQRIEMASVNPGDYIEERLVKTAIELKAAMAETSNHIRSAWVSKVSDLAPFNEAPEEDPAVTIARLQGELASLKGESPTAEETQKRRGRPRKEESAA